MNYPMLWAGGGVLGELRFAAFRKDGTPMFSSAFVRHPVALECEFPEANRCPNEPHFFGPMERA